ncbi:DNA-binding LytR/AlgR family response regulator [Streptomyces sp. V4I23]|uniref:LytR/AlgR family response regulator transcription factor n=1 Tax=Streptomyces sp. V4I23 TaxID=3042282 RepID=UPI002782E0E4|nr:LytTR family DNA-binding domain-containing protein [Streptomyces sp. V4I23]MDQ1012436.1 DNA-binding LytR/AlgR family response regulator [Streptomyces sp. V4I23]
MLHILAVDDEVPALEELAYLLRCDPRVAEVRTANDGAQALLDIGGAMEAGRPLDAVFLDIGMPGLDGVSIARAVSRFARPPRVVFVTAHEDYAVDAFTLHAVDYVLKPVARERLAEAVRRVADEADETADEPADQATQAAATPADEVICVELAGVTRFVKRSEVLYAEAHGDYARLHAPSGTHLVRTPLAALEERWRDAGFIRIHRSYLVALSEVTELRMEGGRTCVRLGDQLLPVSRRHLRQVREALVRHARTSPPDGRPAGPPSPGGAPSATVVPPVQRRPFPDRGGAR